jgi:competence protein ComEA
MATTPAERKALMFLGVVAVLGVGARVVDGVRGGGDRLGPMQPALERQLARAEGAARRARAEREAREVAKKVGKKRGTVTRAKGAGAARDSSAPRGPIDMDTADSIALAALPGVGPSLARRILQDRGAHGPFGGVEALDQVPGVGPKLLERLAPHVTFSGPRRPILGTGRAPSGARRRPVIGRSHPAPR